jgi:uncharacterized membrane protein YdjX (TVP38/TMEM64 family)
VKSLRLPVLAVTVLAAFAAAVLVLPHSPTELRELVLAAGIAAPLIGLAAWMVLVPALFPGTVLAAASGLAFGAVGGVVLSLAGAVLGGLVAFGIARTGARTQVEALTRRSERMTRLHGLLEQRGFLAVLTARLTPGVPASGLHYAAGASPVAATTFAAAMGAGALVRTLPYAHLGQGIGTGSSTAIAIAAVSICIGALTAFVLIRKLRTPLPA